MAKTPSYDGAGLVNLVAEIERRLTGESPSPGLTQPDLVPEADTYVVVLFDGLGSAQLEHPAARSLREAAVADIDAPFPSTTSVSLATIATGLAPSQHGVVAHLSWLPDVGRVVNTLKWVDLTGAPVTYDYAAFLPENNLWERLRQAGNEPITVQPGDFTGSPLTRVLYRGVRFEPAWDVDDLVKATAQLSAEPGRLIFTYVPHVDFAGHVFGLESDEFTDAMNIAVSIWEGIAASLAPGAALLGTADHGLAEFDEKHKVLVRDQRFDGLRFAGDTRGVQLWGDEEAMGELTEFVDGELIDPAGLIGPQPTATALSRLGKRLLIPPEEIAVLPRGFDKRLRCYHGGLSDAEVRIPVLIG